ncbi:hypothetical protein DAPPUDRAFT_113881 [Daphnia pulex]|uniref:SARAH domain-containing protein n=1 Tax=Daphnia pulex TaxID=6669 RepID=E9HGD7_DAPPU|nr:hypothetical protein DAPPUDRAFT_113881 [Daphnia pulex]|eukprot:EFX69209.1 hypothetical protein DAPPUDRAFT_113881 [Daphnia pulex]
MGQSLSLNNHQPPNSRLTSPTSHRQSLKRVHSEEVGDGKRTSISLPASPSFRRRAVSADPQHEQLESPSKSPLSFDSMLKNFEEFAQHQWPTWAKRRGWIADIAPETVSPSTVATDDGSGRVIQVDKDKWIFLRPRKKCAISISPMGVASIPVETVIEEDVLLDCAVGKMVDILHIDETRIVTGINGQRSRRSSGYASASSSPSAIKRIAEPSTASVAITTAGGHLVVPEDSNDDWRFSSLYEVTLRWMFEADSSDLMSDASSSQQSFESKAVNNNQSVLNDSGTSSLGEMRPTEEDSFLAATESSSETIRIYLHFFCRQKNKLPSFIDFRPIPRPTYDIAAGVSDNAVVRERQMYALVFQDGSPGPQTSFPRDIACIELVQQIVEAHPHLSGWEPKKLAIYEKSWQPGKTSRARLRRLNDFDCPLLLAQHWQADDTNLDASSCAKTLILQESQNGDIPWEEFTVAELSSFLKVLEREEKNHEMQIRERYQLLNERLRETMQLSNPTAYKSISSNQTNHLAVSN